MQCGETPTLAATSSRSPTPHRHAPEPHRRLSPGFDHPNHRVSKSGSKPPLTASRAAHTPRAGYSPNPRFVATHSSGTPDAPRETTTAHCRPGYTALEAAARSATAARADSRSVVDISRPIRAGAESRTAGTKPADGAPMPPPLGATDGGGGEYPAGAAPPAPPAAAGGRTDPYGVTAPPGAPPAPPAGTPPIGEPAGEADRCVGALAAAGAADIG